MLERFFGCFHSNQLQTEFSPSVFYLETSLYPHFLRGRCGQYFALFELSIYYRMKYHSFASQRHFFQFMYLLVLSPHNTFRTRGQTSSSGNFLLDSTFGFPQYFLNLFPASELLQIHLSNASITS